MALAEWLGTLLLAITLSLTNCQDELRIGESIDNNPCRLFSSSAENKATCGNCIRISPLCAWCSFEGLNVSESRCELYDHLRNICPPKDLVYPRSSQLMAKDDNVRGGDRSAEPIQVQPQVLNMTVRTNEAINFKIKFRQAENYPVDLYFLLDLSYTMVEEEEAQKRLIALGKEMPSSMENITTNFKLGFGTFVDKTVMPYTGWTEELLKARCQLPNKACSAPHDFINQLKLGSDSSAFQAKMEKALLSVSQSFDDSEGGMDGLLQSLVCEKEIGWRERSRRIVVYSSNSMFHVAGDGLFGGATRFYDGMCHLNTEGSYSPQDREFDFPSVSQIARMLEDKSASVIFAVMPSVKIHYEKLKALIGSAEIGLLEEKSSNIVQLIRNNYDKLRSRILFIPRRDDGVEFTFRSKCLGDVMMETRECDGLEIKDQVEFDVTMTVSSEVCKGVQGIVERPVELAALGLNEKLTINLRIMCSCECEMPGSEVKNSPKCSEGHGTFECGICDCNQDRHGRLCECDESEITSEKSLADCRRGNETVVCSGNGDCLCGLCQCFPISRDTARTYSGEHCQCNDYSCARSEEDGSLCGGPTHGTCKCGTCNCLKGWKGNACDCSTDNSTCIAANGKECNGVGECRCGKCRCHEKSNYMGPTCEECPGCPTKCTQYKDCAQCKGFGTGKYTTNECDEFCADTSFEVVDELKKGDRVTSCDFRDTDQCLFHFTYEYDQDNNVIIKIQKTKECPEEVNLALILGPVVAAVVLIPLLLIFLFIFFRNRRDAREFARFMKEKESARWEAGANPIYKDPKSTFKNPTYKGGK